MWYSCDTQECICAGDSRSKAGAGPVALSEKELQHIAVADVERQVAGVEAVYKALMSQVISLIVTNTLFQRDSG